MTKLLNRLVSLEIDSRPLRAPKAVVPGLREIWLIALSSISPKAP